MSRIPKPEGLGPVHWGIIHWARDNAYGHRSAVPRSALVDAIALRLDETGFQWLAQVVCSTGPRGDRQVDRSRLDREVRAMTAELPELGYPVLSCCQGYYYANPADWRDLARFRWHMFKRAIACLRRVKWARFAIEDEARRLAGDRRIVQPVLPPPAAWRPPSTMTWDESGQQVWA